VALGKSGGTVEAKNSSVGPVGSRTDITMCCRTVPGTIQPRKGSARRTSSSKLSCQEAVALSPKASDSV
jgi:hypothetical protein